MNEEKMKEEEWIRLEKKKEPLIGRSIALLFDGRRWIRTARVFQHRASRHSAAHTEEAVCEGRRRRREGNN